MSSPWGPESRLGGRHCTWAKAFQAARILADLYDVRTRVTRCAAGMWEVKAA